MKTFILSLMAIFFCFTSSSMASITKFKYNVGQSRCIDEAGNPGLNSSGTPGECENLFQKDLSNADLQSRSL
ncbi:MAG TPA: hypothetical protein VI754_07000 [Bacteriovoracaceae bacterium]|nr:hypothetical protein [Bacteriovoracaceae bacterium]